MLQLKRNDLFTKYYTEYRKQIFYYIRKRVNNNELAEDIVSDTFMDLLENLEKLNYKEGKGVKSWLYKVARNNMIDHFRRKSTNTERAGIDPDFFDVLGVVPDESLKDIIKEEQLDEIFEALTVLSNSDKEVVSLRLVDELSFQEVADIMEKSEAAVKMQFYRAIDKIKDQVEG